MFDLALCGSARPLVRAITGVTTADDYQVNVAPGLPAYTPVPDKWIKKQESSSFYATDRQPVIKAGTEFWSSWGRQSGTRPSSTATRSNDESRRVNRSS